MKVNLFDTNFQHTKDIIGCYTSTYRYPPKELEWEFRHMNYDGITVFTDSMIFSPEVDEVKSRLKVAWLMEPPAIHPWSYEKIIEVEDKFDYILTFEENLLKRGSKYIKYLVGQSRVPDEIAGLYPKCKNMSLIASNKNMSDGHRYRYEVANNIAKDYEIDLWGYAYKRFEDKVEPLKDYRFSIAITNSRINNYFTEILLDCFRLGTVPIFWGCPNIGEYFDIRGMEIFNTIDELRDVLKNLKPYHEYEKYLYTNFELCKQYIHTDDYIAKILKKL